MKTTTIAALAFGLSLAGAPAFAADYGQGRDRDNNQPAADQQQDKNDKGDRKHDRRNRDNTQTQQQTGTPPSGMHQSDWQNNNNRGDDNDRTRDRDRSNDNNWGNDRRRDNNWSNQNNRRGYNWTQYRRNFKSTQRFRIGVYHAPRGYYYRRWHYGQRLPIAFYARDYWLLDFIAFGLFAPPPGCVWVRYGDDALLIDTYTGEIIQVRYDVFYS